MICVIAVGHGADTEAPDVRRTESGSHMPLKNHRKHTDNMETWLLIIYLRKKKKHFVNDQTASKSQKSRVFIMWRRKHISCPFNRLLSSVTMV